MVLFGTQSSLLIEVLELRKIKVPLSVNVTFCCYCFAFDRRVAQRLQQSCHLQTFDELRSLTWILENCNRKWNDNCIMCSNDSYYNNGDGDLEAWEEQEDRPPALTYARERASSGNSQGVRARHLVWHSEPSIHRLTQQLSIGVTLWV